MIFYGFGTIWDHCEVIWGPFVVVWGHLGSWVFLGGSWGAIFMILGVILGPPNGPEINKKQLFVVTFFRMLFFSMFSCIFDPSRPIFVDSWSCGEPFGYVKHRSKCTFAFSDIFAIFGGFCAILSRFLIIFTSFLVPKSPLISKNGVSELRSKIDR